MKLFSFNLLLSFLLVMVPTFYVIHMRVGEKRTAKGRFVKRDGSPGTIDGLPNWQGRDPAIFKAVASEDGYSCDIPVPV